VTERAWVWLAAPASGPRARRTAAPAPRRFAARLLAAALASTMLGACAAVDAPRPAERCEVRPGGPRRTGPLAVGEAVPDFVAPGLGGGIVRWRDRDGSATVLVVWAAWCPYCQRLLPPLARVARDFPAVRVLTVTTSIGRSPRPAPRELVEQHGLAFAVALDDADNTLARALGVSRYPTVHRPERDGADLHVLGYPVGDRQDHRGRGSGTRPGPARGARERAGGAADALLPGSPARRGMT
jgi:peroxiredoxin